MKTKLFSLLGLSVLVLVMFMSAVSAVTYTETFENAEPELPGSYNDGSFVGDNESIIWTYVEAYNEEDYAISGNSLLLRDLASGSKIISSTISGGIGSFSVQLKKGFEGDGDRQVVLYINGELKDTSEAFDDTSTHLFAVDNINTEGDFTIEIRNTQDINAQIVIDDITWTEYTALEPICGNGIVEADEECDDNNTISGDGCSSTCTIEPEELNFCEYDDGVSENPGELDVNIKDITVVQGFGDDEEWLLLDEIEVEVEIENSGDYDVDDISVEWGLYNVDDGEWAIEMDEEDEFNLKDGDEERLIITFKVDENDFDLNLDELGNSYTLFVRATGEVDDGTKPKTCISDSEDIQIIIESDFVILNNFELNGFPLENNVMSSESVQCGADVEITADVWNIGDRDQEDVYVIVYNKELGIINEKIEIGDIDAFEDEKLVFNFKVPQDLKEKWYALELRIYDEDDDLYENYDDAISEFSISLEVEGNCIVEPQINVIPNVESGGKAGEELVIKATITNTGNDLVTYELDVTGYDDWAELISVEPSTIILEAGEPKDVLITFNVNQDAAGKESSFDIIFSGDASATQHVQGVLIEKSGFSFTGDIISEGNWYLWGIGALNIILVIVIILVAMKVAKKE